MIKRIISSILLCVLLFCCTSVSSYANDNNCQGTLNESLLFELLAKVDADDKNAMTIDRMEALNFGIEEVRDADTETLLDLCLNNFFICVIVFHDNALDGLDFFTKHFTPAQLVLGRDDASSVIINKLKADEKLSWEQKVFLETLLVAVKQNSKSFNSLWEGEIDSILDYTTYVYTPMGTQVTVEYRTTELSNSVIQEINDDIATYWPNVVELDGPTRKYNCHSYTWYSHSTSNTYHMADPSAYMTDGSYIAVASNYSSLTYIYYYYGNHSALRLAGSTNVRSKWGDAGLYIHAPGYCPYDDSVLTYWKLNTNIPINNSSYDE